jgi:hypothetical protein
MIDCGNTGGGITGCAMLATNGTFMVFAGFNGSGKPDVVLKLVALGSSISIAGSKRGDVSAQLCEVLVKLDLVPGVW